MKRITIGDIVKTSIVTAFTLAVALIWKDVIIDSIKILVPAQDLLFYKFLAASISTVLIVVIIYIILKTENRAEYVVKKFRKKDGKRII